MVDRDNRIGGKYGVREGRVPKDLEVVSVAFVGPIPGTAGTEEKRS